MAQEVLILRKDSVSAIAKNKFGILALILMMSGLLLNKSFLGSILVISSIISFYYWLIKTLKNRLFAFLIITLVILVLYLLLPIVRQYA